MTVISMRRQQPVNRQAHWARRAELRAAWDAGRSSIHPDEMGSYRDLHKVGWALSRHVDVYETDPLDWVAVRETARLDNQRFAAVMWLDISVELLAPVFPELDLTLIHRWVRRGRLRVVRGDT